MFKLFFNLRNQQKGKEERKKESQSHRGRCVFKNSKKNGKTHSFWEKSRDSLTHTCVHEASAGALSIVAVFKHTYSASLSSAIGFVLSRELWTTSQLTTIGK